MNNPWAGVGASPAGDSGASTGGPGSFDVGAAAGAMQAAGQYPAMSNQFGLGQGAIPGTSSDPNYMTKKLTSAPGNESSRGFNPWSLQGESNARGD